MADSNKDCRVINLRENLKSSRLCPKMGSHLNAEFAALTVGPSGCQTREAVKMGIWTTGFRRPAPAD